MSLEAMKKPMAATPHKQLIDELMDSRIPKSEREHAAAREIEKLRKVIEAAEKQEPVAWLQLTAYGDKLLSFNKPSEEKVHYYTSLKLHDPKNIPLYTHPQPKLREKNT